MKKKYADFNKLNRLLVASFEAEKLYYNAAMDAQNTDLKRFLNYMSVERNRMSHDISNELHSREIEPLKDDAEKGEEFKTWQEIKEALENYDAESIIKHCVSRDLYNLKRYEELIERKELPDSILLMLEKQSSQIQWYTKQAVQYAVKSPFKESTNQQALSNEASETKKNDDGGKVIPLKAM